jgi:signal transduction histidine kinase
LGVSVLAGWWLGIPRLQNVWRAGPLLPFNGGLLLLLLGAALGLMHGHAAGTKTGLRYRAGQAAALLAATAGLVTLAEYLFGWNPGIDEWFWKDPLAAARKAIPGRISFQTALAVVGLGLGLFLLDVRIRKLWPAQALGVISGLTAFLGLIGYACDVPEFYQHVRPISGTGMAVQDVAGLLILSVGVLLARPERGLVAVLWSNTPGGMMARWLMLAPALGLLLTGIVYLTLHRGFHVDLSFRTWVLGLSNMIFLTVPIWVAAHALHQVGLERDEAHRELEARVRRRTAALTRTNAALQAEIVERCQAEEALREARDRLESQAVELECRVAERTAKLRETIGDLEAFSYSLAHDMRAPLRGMQGFARLLLEEHAAGLSVEAHSYLERIASSASRMDVLIQDVLDYARVLRTDTPLAPVDLDRLVRHLGATYPDWQPPKADIQIVGVLPAALGHEGFLTQCVSNLIGNAVKFVAAGVTPRVRIWAEARGLHVRVWVEDNGIGIAPKDHDRIFRMFERVHHAGQYEGTGIGLAVVRKAVERLGGHVDFESEPGRGSRFWLELNRAPERPATPCSRREAVSATALF